MTFTIDAAAVFSAAIVVAAALIKLSREISTMGEILRGLGKSVDVERAERKEADASLGASLDRERTERREEDDRLEERLLQLERR